MKELASWLEVRLTKPNIMHQPVISLGSTGFIFQNFFSTFKKSIYAFKKYVMKALIK